MINLKVLTNENDWVQVFYNDDLIWEDHNLPSCEWQLKEFLNNIGLEVNMEIIYTEF